MLTYQDDVMLTSIKLAGYPGLTQIKLRKAMGKKSRSYEKRRRKIH